jgi:hypothetical protein
MDQRVGNKNTMGHWRMIYRPRFLTTLEYSLRITTPILLEWMSMMSYPDTQNIMKNHHVIIKTAAALGLLISAPLVQADSFTGFSMDFADIGNAGNANDGVSGNTAYGGVSYNYRMGVNEVSETMIDSYNTANSGVLITKDTRGANRPATSVSWNEAARFVNWLNTSQNYQAAYNVSGGANTDIALWSSADAWQTGGENLFRHKDAHYFLPSENEWYKAAYYDGSTGAYYDYATGSDTEPDGIDSSGDATFDAVFYDGFIQSGPNDVTNAGVLSPYGTMAQNGNVWEWGESGYGSPNNLAGELRVIRSGSWNVSSPGLQSSYRNDYSPASGSYTLGFRVAAVPEPSSIALLGLGGLAMMLRRRR